MKPRLHGDASAGVRRLVESKVGEVLTGQPGLAKGAAADTAQIAAVVAAAVIALPLAQQKRLKAKIADVVDMIAALACNDDLAECVEVPEPVEIEQSKGSGFGELIDVGEGRIDKVVEAVQALQL